jgi:hypothetical protein
MMLSAIKETKLEPPLDQQIPILEKMVQDSQLEMTFIGTFFCKSITKSLIPSPKDLSFKPSGLKCNSKARISNCES